MAKSKMDSEGAALPDSTIWARAVLLGTAVLGVTHNDRTANAKNVEHFGRKAREIASTLEPKAKLFVDTLETRMKAVGGNLDCDRLRTARSALALCSAITDKEALDIINVLANARLDTSSSAVQASLASLDESLATLQEATVVSTLAQLVELERGDLSASKYLREAKTILQQDEMRRSLELELRMVIGAAQAYLSTGKQSMLGASAFESQDYDFTTPLPPSTIAKVVAPVDVVIEAKKRPSPPPPSQPRTKREGAKKTPAAKTLASEEIPVVTKVSVERKGSGLDREAARALIQEAAKEALEKIENGKLPLLVNVVLTMDVVRE